MRCKQHAWTVIMAAHVADVDFCAKRVDNLLDDIAVSACALVMDLLDGIGWPELDACPDHTPQLLSHLRVAALQRHIFHGR